MLPMPWPWPCATFLKWVRWVGLGWREVDACALTPLVVCVSLMAAVDSVPGKLRSERNCSEKVRGQKWLGT